uniref:Cytochrome c domain-containing protein n=1 Tax=Leptocylindrus danicus TaxID=163516 RepID=A0A7S2KWM0_9STRA
MASTASLRTVFARSALLTSSALAFNANGNAERKETKASDDCVHAPHHHWNHTGSLSSFDCAAVRRGFQVYRQVCATCHSVELVCWRNLVNVTHPELELKAMAEEVEYVDGPNDEGEMFDRPGKLADPLPKPYANDEAGRAANGGALPPDLSLMVKARHSGLDYVFSLLTGYCDAPAGKVMPAGLYYNPYFPGGAISMPPPLMDGQVEYEDGTPATVTQMAKDVSVFLNWTAEPEHDERKKNGFQNLVCMAFFAIAAGYLKRARWSTYKTRAISYVK